MKICVVCMANYCRSPVAEVLLNERGNINAISAGISPIISSDMDPRSRLYLESLGLNPQPHIPRPISNEIFKEYDLILAADTFVLMKLNSKFSKFINKIKMLSFQNPKLKLKDPFKLDEEEYLLVMDDIKTAVDSIKIE